MRVGRIPYINCYPVYGAIDRGIVPISAELVDGVPTALNHEMSAGTIDVSVISAVEYARDAMKYLLLPDLSICSDGPVRSVVLFSKRPASDLHGRRVLVSRSSMTSVALLELLFDNVWDAKPAFIPSNAELVDVARFGEEEHDARLVIGDAALHLWSRLRSPELYPKDDGLTEYRYAYDLGSEWKRWTGLPFVFAVWVTQRTTLVADSLGVHASLIASPRHACRAGGDRDRRPQERVSGVFVRPRLRIVVSAPRGPDRVLPASRGSGQSAQRVVGLPSGSVT
jgi:chorismate dehydratase